MRKANGLILAAALAALVALAIMVYQVDRSLEAEATAELEAAQRADESGLWDPEPVLSTTGGPQ